MKIVVQFGNPAKILTDHNYIATYPESLRNWNKGSRNNNFPFSHPIFRPS
jgi:hypothetical protein